MNGESFFCHDDRDGLSLTVATATQAIDNFHPGKIMNFEKLQQELESAIIADEKYQRENSAKFRAVEQRVATYDEFRDIVKASHLKPLDKKEKLAEPNVPKKVIWNAAATNKVEDEMLFFNESKKSKKHFTEM